MLLSFGWDASESSVSSGATPLMAAASIGNIGVVGSLLEAGAGVVDVCHLGYTAVHHAAAAGDDTLLEMLFSAAEESLLDVYYVDADVTPEGTHTAVECLLVTALEAHDCPTAARTLMSFGHETGLVPVGLSSAVSTAARLARPLSLSALAELTCLPLRPIFLTRQAYVDAVRGCAAMGLPNALRLFLACAVQAGGERLLDACLRPHGNANICALALCVAAQHPLAGECAGELMRCGARPVDVLGMNMAALQTDAAVCVPSLELKALAVWAARLVGAVKIQRAWRLELERRRVIVAFWAPGGEACMFFGDRFRSKV